MLTKVSKTFVCSSILSRFALVVQGEQTWPNYLSEHDLHCTLASWTGVCVGGEVCVSVSVSVYSWLLMVCIVAAYHA